MEHFPKKSHPISYWDTQYCDVLQEPDVTIQVSSRKLESRKALKEMKSTVRYYDVFLIHNVW